MLLSYNLLAILFVTNGIHEINMISIVLLEVTSYLTSIDLEFFHYIIFWLQQRLDAKRISAM